LGEKIANGNSDQATSFSSLGLKTALRLGAPSSPIMGNIIPRFFDGLLILPAIVEIKFRGPFRKKRFGPAEEVNQGSHDEKLAAMMSRG